MAGSLNRVSLIGHLGKDPEVRRLNNGNPVVSFSVATTESWKDQRSGERQERTEWHNIVIFNEALCGIAEQYLSKGSKVFIEGKMQTRKWQDQSGADKYTTEVVLQAFNGQLIMLSPQQAGNADRGDSDDGYSDSQTNSNVRNQTRSVANNSGNRRTVQRQNNFGRRPAQQPNNGQQNLDDEIPF